MGEMLKIREQHLPAGHSDLLAVRKNLELVSAQAGQVPQSSPDSH